MPSSISDFNKSLRNQFTFIGVLFVLSFSTFYLGWGQMRYSATTIIPIETFVFWRFAMAGWLPLVAFFVTAMFVVQMMLSVTKRKIRGLALFSGVHIVVCFLALVWTLIFCAWEITAWTECNDPGPKHPECRNRQYPEETIADYSFIMMVISSAVNAGIMGWCLYFNSMVGIMRKAMTLTEQGVITEKIGAKHQRRAFGVHTEPKKAKHHDKEGHKSHYSSADGDWMKSQGVY